MDPNYTHLVVVLDRSGSMWPVKSDAVKGFNNFINEQKIIRGKATVTFVQFDHEFEMLYDFKPIEVVPLLTVGSYQPRGSTALLDAIGRTIISVGHRLAEMPERCRPSRVIFAIITDGQENSSVEFHRSHIFDMISHQETKYNWQFLFLSSSKEAITDAIRLYGIPWAHTHSFYHSGEGVRNGFAAMSECVTAYRNGGDCCFSGTETKSEVTA